MAVLWDENLKRADAHVYAVLARAVWEGRTASIGLRRIAEQSRMTYRCAQESMSRLIKHGHVKLYKGKGERPGMRAIYFLTSPLFGSKQGKVDTVSYGPNGPRLVSVEKKPVVRSRPRKTGTEG